MFKKIDWSQWYLFFIGVCVVEIVSVYLLWKAYPGEEMRIMGWAILILVLGIGAYSTVKASEPDEGIRQVGIVGKVVLALLGVLSLYGHSSMSRQLSTSREGYAERQKIQKDKSDAEDAAARRQIALSAARSQEMSSQAALEKEEARKLRLLAPSQREALKKNQPAGGSGVSQSQAPAGEVTFQPTPTPMTLAESTALSNLKTQAEVREEWMFFFQVVNFLQILISVLIAAAVNWVRHWDKGGIIGVPDWIERIWASGENGRQYIRQSYPEYVSRLENAGAGGLEPGKATA